MDPPTDDSAMKATLEQGLSLESLPTLTQVFEAMEPTPWPQASESVGDVQAQWSWQVAIAAMVEILKHHILDSVEFAANAPEATHSAPAHSAPAHSAPAHSAPAHSASVCDPQGVVFCGPSAVFSDPALLAHLKTWIFTPEGQTPPTFQLPPATKNAISLHTLPVISIPKGDRLLGEQFCLIQTPQFSWVAILGPNPDLHSEETLQFRFSFDPSTVEQIWRLLKVRVQYSPIPSMLVESWRKPFPAITPDYRIPVQFSRELLHQSTKLKPHRPKSSLINTNFGTSEFTNPWDFTSNGIPDGPSTERVTQPLPKNQNANGAASQHPNSADRLRNDQNPQESQESQGFDVELLKVLAHEVKTPLTTIQTLACLLLKRSDLPKEVIKRIESIRRECSGQIDRFGLLFRAMELTHDQCQALPNRLTPISLHELLEENLARWQTHAARRDLTVQVTTPKQMPAIAIRDPHLFDQVLTGLMEYLGHSLSVGSHIHLHVSLAGAQLKLQLQTYPDENQPTDPMTESPMLKAVGQLLMFQPETGGLSLSLPATKHLFQALGGKLTVRKHEQSEVLTIFLPLGTESDAY